MYGVQSESTRTYGPSVLVHRDRRRLQPLAGWQVASERSIDLAYYCFLYRRSSCSLYLLLALFAIISNCCSYRGTK